MLFNSFEFLIFLPIVFLLYWFVFKPLRWQNLFIVAVSYIFYGWWDWRFLILIAFTTLCSFASGIVLERLEGQRTKQKWVSAANITLNLLILCIFKYFNFFGENLAELFQLFGVGADWVTIDILLPVGISFYTFQALSYVIDVYRGTVAAQKNPITFGTYIALFPQLIAGPIVQYKTVEEQLSHRRETTAQFAAGIGRFTIGLGKKVLIANQVGALWDTVAALPGTGLSAGTAWLGAIAFTFQIYFDFSGYSDMAIGLGKMLGFEFLENFDYPYLSRSITEYWRRWHISLGTWFREYVYIPLGGNRRGKGRQLLNLFIVWGLTGLWHGASWNFLLWGLYYGVILIIEKVWLQKPLQKAPGVVQRLYSLLLIILGWVIFALTDFGAIGNYFAALFGAHGGADAQTMYLLTTNISLLLVAALACTRWPAHAANDLLARLPQAAQTLLRCLFYAAVLLMCVAFLVGDSYNPFLYFRF